MPYIVKYALKRIALMLVTAFVILTLTFILVKMLPNGVIAGNEDAQYAFCMDQVGLGYYIDSIIERPELGNYLLQKEVAGVLHYFYKKPIIEQYFAWLSGIFTQWNWGLSSALQPSASALTIIGQRMGPTVIINIFTMIISVPLGFVFGIIAALNKNKAPDHFLSTLVMVMISVPSFVVISVLMLILAYNTNLLPSTWPQSGAPIEQFARAMVIPVLALSFGTVAGFTRYTRAELTEVMSSEFLLLARTKGLTKSQCIVRHALRNSMVPIVPMIIGEFVGILSGSMVLEQLYSIPGIGSLFVECIRYKDWNVLLVDMALYTMIGLVANLLVDLSYGIIDPRIRMGAKAS